MTVEAVEGGADVSVSALRQLVREGIAEEKYRGRTGKNKNFVQFSREGMEAYASLIRKSPTAAQVLVYMAAHMSRENLVKAPVDTLRGACGSASRAAVSRAIALLNGAFIVRTPEHGASTYAVNAWVFWSTHSGKKLSGEVFWHPISARVIEDGKSQGVTTRYIPVMKLKLKKQAEVIQLKTPHMISERKAVNESGT